MPRKSTRKEKEPVDEEDNSDHEDIPVEKKTRQQILADSISASFDYLITTIGDELKSARSSNSKVVDVKFVRTMLKTIKDLHKQVDKIQPKKRAKRQGSSTGLNKPVKISSSLAKFTGFDEDELHSRLDVTRYICEYIKEHNLQNPENRSHIIPDQKLQKLLGYNPKESEKPLTYFGIQSCLKKQNHYPG